VQHGTVTAEKPTDGEEMGERERDGAERAREIETRDTEESKVYDLG